MNIRTFLCLLLLGSFASPTFAEDYFFTWEMLRRTPEGPTYEIRPADIDRAAIEVLQQNGKQNIVYLNVTFTPKGSLAWSSFLLDHGAKPFTIKVGDWKAASTEPIKQGDTINLEGRSVHLVCPFDEAVKLVHQLIPPP